MSDSDLPDEQLDDAELERLLSSIVHDTEVSFPARITLRRRMIGEFDRSLGGTSAAPGSESSESSRKPSPASPESTAAIIEACRHPPPERSKRRNLLYAAVAAAAFVCGTSLAFSVVQRQDDSTRIDAGSSLSPTPSNSASGGDSNSGETEHRTEALGTPATLVLPEGAEVLAERPGMLVLGREGDRAEPRAQVQLISVEPDVSLIDLIGELADSGAIKPVESRATADGLLVTHWELRVTNDGAERFGCVSAGPCAPLGPIELWSKGINYVAEITGPDDQSVWWVEQSTLHQDPFLERATDILATLQFE